MEKEFKIITDANGIEHVRDELSEDSCILCGKKINLITAAFNRGACKKCSSENPQIWFDEKMSILPLKAVLDNRSPFGNHFYEITKNQIEELLNGGVLYSGGEYGTFIKLMEEEQ